MPVGGENAKDRIVMTISHNGRAIVSLSITALVIAVIGMCCTQFPPPIQPVGPGPAPQPTVVVDAGYPDDVAPDAVHDAPPDRCVFTEPRARTARRTPRIVGGRPAPEGKYPAVASISDGAFHYCGGSVIGPRAVLTAAHCQVLPGDNVRVGSVNRLSPTQKISVVQSRIHPNYDPVSFKNDVAILVLASDANVEFARLSEHPPDEAAPAMAIGWGRLSEGGNVTNFLQEVSVPIVPLDECDDTYPGVDDSQVCADKALAGSCQGDSGSQLLQFTPEGYVQIGIVSYGIGCARDKFPGVYTSVYYQPIRNWISVCSRV